MKIIATISLILFANCLLAQDTATLSGKLQDQNQAPIQFANVILYQAADSTMVKVESSDEKGAFSFVSIPVGTYFLKATYVGYADLEEHNISLSKGMNKQLGVLNFSPTAVNLESAIVTATRAMVEVKPDRTVFNVQGTINSTGSDAVELLRKAPGVLVDNNNNITVLGRSGVLVYVDGKRLPLSGEQLSTYLQNLPADQIDRFDIITNPGAKYEAEGNAGIIDIRLKRNESHGANGSVNLSGSKGRYARANMGVTGNYRNKVMNVFASGNLGKGKRYNDMIFRSRQNGLYLDEINNNINENDYYNVRLGSDFFIGEKQTIGFLISRGENANESEGYNRINIAKESNRTEIDSILVANSFSESDRKQTTFNANYRFDNKKGRSLNIDLDYGTYIFESDQFQPNTYLDSEIKDTLSSSAISYNTPSDIGIYTFKMDFEEEIWGGKLGLGTKLSKVESDNDFLFYNVLNGENIFNANNSNRFIYDEKVYATYVNFTRPINQKWSFSAGLRNEVTDALGTLDAYAVENSEEPVEQNYTSWFPSAGLTWTLNPNHVFSLNYGRRINRPDYSVLNPFNNQLSELSYEKGNPSLKPEIVNNIELSYTHAYRYNFKIGYSRTHDQITRLLSPDPIDPRAGFITWDNLSTQDIFSANVSLPIQVKKWWNAYINLGASYIDNQADYGNNGVVDVQAFNYSMYQQHTFTLAKGFTAELSGWFSGPGIWGGVFEYDPSFSINAGLQKKILKNAVNIRLNVSDIFYETGWSGVSDFRGSISEGQGNWDSRRVSLSISYNFGNQKVKSRKRKTGIEEESGRLGKD